MESLFAFCDLFAKAKNIRRAGRPGPYIFFKAVIGISP